MMATHNAAADRLFRLRLGRGRPPKGYFPPTRKQLLDVARKEALSVALTGQSGAKMHRDCGSLPTSDHRWFCVQTHPGQERRAATELRDQDFIVFLPMWVNDDIRGARTKIQPRPATPRYLFVAFDPAVAPWRRIFSTRGVSRLFTYGDFTPAAAPRGDVERLIKWVRDGADKTVAAKRAAEAFPVGSAGEVVDGPFTSFPCVLIQQDEDGSLRVEVTIFGRSTPVQLERSQVSFGS